MVQDEINRVAKWCLKNGISVVPIGEAKTPEVRWKEYNEHAMSPDEWNFPGCNIGIITGQINKLVVVDCDSFESYTGWLKHRPPTPLRVRSKRGMHFWYRHTGEYVKSDSHIQAKEGFEYDVKGDRAYVLLPPSLRDGHQYQFCICAKNPRGKFIHPSELPEFDPSWRPDRVATDSFESPEIKNISRYMSSIFAVDGQGGDKTTYKVCVKLRDSGIDESEAMALLAEWNSTNCQPPWQMRDLHRKLRAAFTAKGS